LFSFFHCFGCQTNFRFLSDFFVDSGGQYATFVFFNLAVPSSLIFTLVSLIKFSFF